MTKELTAQEKAILDRWNPHRLTWKIANHFDLSENQIRHIKSKATFKAETPDSWPSIRARSTRSSWDTAVGASPAGDQK